MGPTEIICAAGGTDWTTLLAGILGGAIGAVATLLATRQAQNWNERIDSKREQRLRYLEVCREQIAALEAYRQATDEESTGVNRSDIASRLRVAFGSEVFATQAAQAGEIVVALRRSQKILASRFPLARAQMLASLDTMERMIEANKGKLGWPPDTDPIAIRDGLLGDDPLQYLAKHG
jgi:hypothetical protein